MKTNSNHFSKVYYHITISFSMIDKKYYILVEMNVRLLFRNKVKTDTKKNVFLKS